MAHDHRNRSVPAGKRDRQYYEESRRLWGSSAPSSPSHPSMLSRLGNNGQFEAANDMGDGSTHMDGAYSAYDDLFDSYE